YADVGSVAAVIGEAIISQPIAETAKKDDIVLEPNVGASSAAAPCASPAKASSGRMGTASRRRVGKTSPLSAPKACPSVLGLPAGRPSRGEVGGRPFA